MSEAGRERAPDARDGWLAGGLALAFALLYALTFQTRYFGDGPGLATLHVLHGAKRYYHVLYLPLCDLVQAVLGAGDRFLAPRLVSSLPAAVGLGAGYLVLRAFGSERFGALVAVGLLALSPALWFFATTIEVHALLFGTVACVAALTLLAPWRRPALALALTCLAFPFLYWAHQAAFTLGLGWVFLVQYARARGGARYSWPGLWLGVGPTLLVALGLGVVVSYLVRFGALAPLVDEVKEQLGLASLQDENLTPHLPAWSHEWLLPLGALVPLALLGLARLRAEAWRASAVGFLVGVPTLFFLWWGAWENGGYFLGSDLFLCVPVALLFGRASRARLLLALTLLAGQGTLARARIEAWDTGWDPRERVAQVRAALGGPGVLLTTTGFAPDIRCNLPDVEELSLNTLVRQLSTRAHALVPPERLAAQLRPYVETLLARGRRVAVELGYPRVTPAEAPVTAALRPSLAALERFLRESYEVRDVPHPWWPMMVLERRR